jgi:hypothetical protein
VLGRDALEDEQAVVARGIGDRAQQRALADPRLPDQAERPRGALSDLLDRLRGG